VDKFVKVPYAVSSVEPGQKIPLLFLCESTETRERERISRILEIVRSKYPETVVKFSSEKEDVRSATFYLDLERNYEPLNTRLIQALSAGCVCFATSAANSREVIASGRGVYLDEADDNEVANKILFTVEHEELARTMSQKGREWALQHNLEHVFQKWLRLLS
jgi:glycosyltransferase involved in cell wall biosynthesis